MKDLLLSHNDLDGISPNILLALTGRKFDAYHIELHELSEKLDELLATDLHNYEHIYITDLTIPEKYYLIFQEKHLTVQVFDHHETHLYGNQFQNVVVQVNLENHQTCATELFFHYLKSIYPIINTPLICHYVELVRQIDTYDLQSDMPKELCSIFFIYTKADFIKKMTRRLQKDAPEFTFTPFEKRYLRLEKEKEKHFFEQKEKEMMVFEIHNQVCGIVFASNCNKSELGHYLSTKHANLAFIAIIDVSRSISYRTNRDDVSVSEFASFYGGGGHKKASGSSFDDAMREEIVKLYFKDVKRLENEIN